MTARIVFGVLVVGVMAWAIQPVDEASSGVEAAVIRMQPEFSWLPPDPAEGTLFRIRATASVHTPIMGIRGEVADEELHFRRVDDRTFETFAAVPVGSSGSISANFRVAYAAGGEQEFDERISVRPGSYVHERLSVAPRFGAPPDSADRARLEEDGRKAREVSRIAHRTPRIETDTVIMPRNSVVTSGFGDGREFNGQITSRHMGLDLRGARGDTVFATARGVVALVDQFLLAGNLVYLNHGGGLISGYFHLSEQLVSVGDTVEAGTPVGRAGATGRVTGPHLHWVVRYGTTSVDPRSLLDVTLTPWETGAAPPSPPPTAGAVGPS